jgi:hypothetical protein
MSELFKVFATGKRLTAKEMEVLASQKLAEVPTEEATTEVPTEEATTEVPAEEPATEVLAEVPAEVPQPTLLEKPVIEETKETFATLTSRRNKSKKYGLVQD